MSHVQGTHFSNSGNWYGHNILRREEYDILRKSLCIKVEVKRRRERLRKTWKNQVEDDIRKTFLKKEDALNQSKWQKGVKMVMSVMG